MKRSAILLVFLVLSLQPGATAVADQTNYADAWTKVSVLTDEQKFAAADESVIEILRLAQAEQNAEHWARALIERVRLRTALGAPETAVRDLKSEPWPDDPQWRGLIELFYAQSLVNYYQRYSYEIRSRETVVEPENEDLKAWTEERFTHAINGAFVRVWSNRETWGAESADAWSMFLEENNYPARIRGTLRDVVSYLWIEHLANTRLWLPGQQGSEHTLDLNPLLTGAPAPKKPWDLTDPRLHPLRKISAVLIDLRNWHQVHERDEAALEAELALVDQLQRAWSNQQDKVRMREFLAARLADFDQAYPWWAKGQWQLATMLKQENDPDSLVRAHEAASSGLKRHRERLGGKMCADIVAEIEAKHYDLSAMSHDAVGKRSIQIRHKNVDKLYFRAWPYDLAGFVRDGKMARPTRHEINALIAGDDPVMSWTVDLPQTVDFRQHETYTGMPVCAPAPYLVIASMRQDFAEPENIMSAVSIIVSDLVLTSQVLSDGTEFLARSGRSGQPLGTVDLTLVNRASRRGKGPSGLRHVQTDDSGRVFVAMKEHENFGVLARHGTDLAWLEHTYFNPRREPPAFTRSFIYTDRSIYRPGQTVHWKVIGYQGNAQRTEFQTLGNHKVKVDLLDHNHQEVLSESQTTNDFGSAAGSFVIPESGLLGSWTIRDSFGGTVRVMVEQYKRPTFEAELLDPAEPLQLNQAASLTGQAKYFFGLPVTSGDVKWRVVRSVQFLRRYWYGGPSNDEVVATGETTLDEKGQFSLNFTAEIDPRLADKKAVFYRYLVEADVTDDGGETRSASRAFNLGFVSLQAKISAASGFVADDKEAVFTVNRSDLNQVPRAGQGRWSLHRLQQPEQTLLPTDESRRPSPDDKKMTRTRGDDLNPRWQPLEAVPAALSRWDVGDRVDRGQLQHGADGEATIKLQGLRAGAYRLTYTTEDPAGQICEAQYDILAAGSNKIALNLPLVLQTETATLTVGDTARFLVHSGLADQELYIQVFEGGQRTRREFRRAGRGSSLIEVPVTAAARLGLQVKVSAVRDHQHLQWTRSVHVPWDNMMLDLEFATFRDRLVPGGDESFTIKVTSPEGAAISPLTTELLAYMYDRSLDTFTPHRPPVPLSVFASAHSVAPLRATVSSGHPLWRGGQRPGRSLQQGLWPDRLIMRADFMVGMRRGELRVRGGRSGDIAMSLNGLKMSGSAKGAAPPPASMAEGVEYMVDVDSAIASHLPDPANAPADAPAEDITLREDFSETAFFLPHVQIDGEGEATIEFKVPDSVTDWNIWVHGLTRDLRSGSAREQASSFKDLMVRPYLPRFMREGDTAQLKVVVNNAGQTALQGEVELLILDPLSGRDLTDHFGLADNTASFRVEPGAGTDLVFGLRAPAQIGSVLIKTIARSDGLSDGEQRTLPILPGRMHLMQSRFVTLDDKDRRELHFSMMAADDDNTRIQDQLIVTVDAQLFGSVLSALPYLLDYPYECTEQTLNRYLSTSILSGVFAEHPDVRAMAQQMSERQTQTEAWNKSDPNRRMLLEETPWLRTAAGGASDLPLINVLDPVIAERQRVITLEKLVEMQAPDGGFPWFPGGPSSVHLTLYILQGLARGAEFGVPAPEALARSAWRYLHTQFQPHLSERLGRKDLSLPQVTMLNYLMSCFSESVWTACGFTADDRRLMLDHSFKHWRQHSHLLKGYLALTLARAERDDDAQLVFAAVMDAAKTDPDLGTYWAPEDRAWLWYNDNVESHAFALRVLTELDPADQRRKGLVQWLLLNKKLGHWKSTRATAEVIYALVHFMKQEGTLATREVVDVRVGAHTTQLVFEPDRYTGKNNQIVYTGDEIEPESMATIVVAKETPGLAFASATWHFSTEEMPEQADGDLFAVTRQYFLRQHDGQQWTLKPLAAGDHVAVGDQIEVQLSVTAKQAAEYVHLRDPRGAGFEPESSTSGYRWQSGLGYYEEVRDSGANFFFSWLPTGQFTLKYRLRASMAGGFKVGPATMQSMYAPEFAAHSAGRIVEIAP